MQPVHRFVANLALVSTLGSMISPAAGSAQKPRLPYEKFTLSNGLTVVVHEDHKAPVVAINVTYHVGSADEVAGKTGFAHLFEHLMYGGSENIHSEFLNVLTEAGATSINGSTSDDRTNFYETVPISSLEYALFAESDRMGHLTVTQETLDLQRGVVQNELRQDRDRPYGKEDEIVVKMAYPALHPYAHETIGNIDDLNAATLEDVRGWLHDHYGPSNATLTLAGDITLESAHVLAQKYFGAIPPGQPVTHPVSWIAKMQGTQSAVTQDHVPQAKLVFIWNVPGYGTADADYLDMVGNVLTDGKNSRLYKSLVYDKQIATSVNGSVDAQVLSGQFTISVMAKKGADLELIRSIVQETVVQMAVEGPTADEMQRVKAQNEQGIVEALESTSVQASLLAEGQVYKDNPSELESQINRTIAATPQQLRDAVNKWLSDGLLELTIQPYPDYHSSATDVTRATPPAIGPPPPSTMPKIQTMTLSNGLMVFLAERHELPLVTLLLSVKAGYSADHLFTPGSATLTSSLMSSGTTTHTALQVSDLLGRLGTQFSASANVDDSTAYMQTLKGNLDPSLDLLSDMVLHPSFPEADFLRQQKLQLARIQQEEAIPNAEAARILPPLLFGANHPYGQPLTGSGTTAAVSKLTRDDIVKFYATWFAPNNSELFVAGDTTLAELRPRLEQAFGSWKAREVPKNNVPDILHPAEAGVYLIDKPGATQSVIIAGSIAPPAFGNDDNALNMWNAVIGSFSGRLNMELRESKHWTYGASTHFIATQHQRPFLVSTAVQADKTKESLSEANRQLREFVTDHPPTTQEVQVQVTKKVRSLPGFFESTNGVMNAMGDIEQFHLPTDYYTTLPAKLLALQAGDVAKAGNSFLNPDNLVWVIIGDRSKIEKDVRSLNLGAFHLIPNNPTAK